MTGGLGGRNSCPSATALNPPNQYSAFPDKKPIFRVMRKIRSLEIKLAKKESLLS